MLGAMQAEIGQTNTDKGFRALPTTVGDRLMLVTSELAEALEEIRAGHAVDEIYFSDGGKPEGYPVELADAMIRILDEFDRIQLDAESVIRLKMDYNHTRPHLHGGKTL